MSPRHRWQPSLGAAAAPAGPVARGAGRGHGRGGPCAAGAAAGSRAGLPMWDSEVDAALSVLVRGWGLLAHPGCFAAAVLECLSCCCWELQLGASAEGVAGLCPAGCGGTPVVQPFQCSQGDSGQGLSQECQDFGSQVSFLKWCACHFRVKPHVVLRRFHAVPGTAMLENLSENPFNIISSVGLS